MGFFALLFMAVMSFVVVAMPPSPDWGCASSADARFAELVARDPPGRSARRPMSRCSATWRIVAASVMAFWAGEFVNSFVMARMKVWTQGKHLWTRTIGSTVFGQAVDSVIFYPVAFLGIWSHQAVLTVMVTNWAMKVAWEVVLTPATYRRRMAQGARRRGRVRYRHGLSPFAKTDAV
jgi:uncharacterized PurR-regulated membrane protein YhhQ (DUF165 family)